MVHARLNLTRIIQTRIIQPDMRYDPLWRAGVILFLKFSKI